MRRLTLLSIAFAWCALAIAQVPQTSAALAPAISGADLVAKYKTYEGAVLNMTREEWEVFRSWDGYDERVHIEILEQHRSERESTAAERRAARIARSGDCDCWVEPDNTYTQVTTSDWTGQGGAGLDVDCYIGPINLNGWNFNLYGSNFNQFWINSKGTVSFGDGYINWTPQEFPAAIYDQLAGFWADSDFRGSGELWYKVTPEAVYVNFVEVGYFNNKSDKVNTFQIIFTPSTGGVLGDDFNVQFCYLDMQWAHGDVGGSNGFNGPTPANVGCDIAATTGANIQYGRFNLNSDVYNGPYGAGPAQQDGVNWLDFKTFNINTVGSASSNIPPIATQDFGCDDVTICLGDTLNIDLQFLAPETGQTVSITVSVDGNDDGLFITNQQSGNIASLQGGFAGNLNTVGTHTITIVATDTGSPAASTTVEVTVEVIPVELPELTVDGNFSVCAGSPTTITASPGFDSYVWSTGCETPSCEIMGSGSFAVTAFFDACSTTRDFEIETTPYFLPCIEIIPNPICSTDTATVNVCGNNLPTFVGFQWDANWNGLGGEVFEDNGASVLVAPGAYRLLVENEEGCFGQRVFVVESIDAFIPADTQSGAYCDGLEDVVFAGGFSNPADGVLTMYLTSSVNTGWSGSFINVIINGETEATYTTTGTFILIQHPITAGDNIQIEFVDSGLGNTDNYTIQLFNCINTNSSVISGLSNGIVYEAPAGCTAEPAFGEWVIESGPAGGSFTVLDQFDSVFSPGDYGLYEVCFYDDACNIPRCYFLEYTEAPEISLNLSEVLLCGDETVTLNASIVDIGGTATIDWPAPGTDDVLTNTYGFDQAQEITLTVTITNGCGSDEASVDVTVQAAPDQPQLEDAILCDDGSVELVALENPGSDVDFEWTLNGTVISDDAEIIAINSGTYCVTVSNLCLPQGLESCAEIALLEPIGSPLDPFTADCDGDNTATVVVNVPSDAWSVQWPDGSTGISYSVNQGGVVTVLITDPGNCETTEYQTTVYIGVAPTVNPSPTEPLVLCPEVTNAFDLGTTNGLEFDWSLSCNPGIDLIGNAILNLNSSQISPDCWGQPLTLTGVAQNPCGTATGTFEVFIDPCAITIPNIFTPNRDGINDLFFVDGLDVYRNVQLKIFDRWGGIVYESDDYRNNWRGDDMNDGTYFYTLLLPNGREHTGTLNVSGTGRLRR